MRMDKDGVVYVLEANPNPQIATGEDFADSAEKANLAYKDLLQELLHVGFRRRPASRLTDLEKGLWRRSRSTEGLNAA